MVHLHVSRNPLKPYWLLSVCAFFDTVFVCSNAFNDFRAALRSCYLTVHLWEMLLSFRMLLDCIFRRSNVCVASSAPQLIGDYRQKLSREFLWTLSYCCALDVIQSCTLLLEALDVTLDMTCGKLPVFGNFGRSRVEHRDKTAALRKGLWFWLFSQQ